MENEVIASVEDRNDDLAHYGVKGMKWGVQNYLKKDNVTRRRLRRRVDATKSNYLKSLRNEVDAKKVYGQRANEYAKVSSSYAMTRSGERKKQARLDAASDALTEAGNTIRRAHANSTRAAKWYSDQAKAYESHVNDMIKKYGSENVGTTLDTATYKVGKIKSGLTKNTNNIETGKQYVDGVLKVGLNFTDMPIAGAMWTSHYVSKLDIQDRLHNANKVGEKDNNTRY